MGKIKLNLVSGSVQEKPLITAFKGTNASYVVLDNEMNGSMGLPIILVCRLENDKLVKINDQTEWGMVKENLKSIIAGGVISYIKVPDTLNADDVYYTQLTLPLPSYDTLKNSYKVEESVSSSDVNPTASIFDINPNPLENLQAPTSDVANPTVENGTPIANVEASMGMNSNPSSPLENANMNTINNVNQIDPSAPVIDLGTPMPNFGNTTTESDPTPISPVIEEAPKVEVTPSPVMDIPNPEVGPVASSNVANNPIPSPIGINEDIFKEQKEAFMQACENMFDALVQRFEKELEKNK